MEIPEDFRQQLIAEGHIKDDRPKKVGGIVEGIGAALNPQRLIDDPFGTLSTAVLPGGPLINAALMAIAGDDGKTPIERAGSAVGAEILSTPGVVAGLIGIGEMGYRTATGTDLDHAAFSDRGLAKTAMLDDPNLPDEIKQIIASTFDLGDLNWGLRNLTANVEWARDFTDVAKNPDGSMPLADETAGIIGSAFVGLPKALMQRAAGRIARSAGQNAAGRFAMGIANSRVGHAALRAAEISTPGTFPLSAGNIAANAGFGIAFNDISRTINGEESIINLLSGAAEQAPDRELAIQLREEASLTARARETVKDMAKDQSIDDLEPTPWDKYLMFGLGAAGAGYVLSALARRPARQIFSAGASINDTSPMNKNRSTFATQGGELDQLFGNRTGIQIRTRMQDASAPAVEAGVLAGMRAEDVEAILGAQTRAGAEQQIRSAIAYGRFSDGTRTVPLAHIHKKLEQLDTAETMSGLDPDNTIRSQWQLAQAYIYAADAQNYRNIARAELSREIAAAQRQFAATTPGSQAWTTASQRVQDLINIYNRDIRMSLTDWDDATLSRIVNAAQNDPAIVAIKRDVEKLLEDVMTYMVNRNMMTKKQAKSWRRRWGDDYMPLYEVETGSAGRGDNTGGSSTHRFARKIGKTIFDQPIITESRPHFDRNRGIKSKDIDRIQQDIFRVQRGETERVRAVNNPEDVVTALYRKVSNEIRYAEANDARRAIVKQMLASPNTQGSVRIRATRTRSQVMNNQYPKDPQLVPIHEGKNVHFVEFGDELVRQSLMFSPQATLGILNSSRKLWQAGTTGVLAPWFAIKGLAFDVTSAMVTKNAGHHLGFIDGLIGMATNSRVHLPGDPTALLDALFNGAGRQIAADVFLRDFGEWFANHLGHSNSMFAQLANLTAQGFGAQSIRAVGETLLNTYMRTSVGIMRNEGAFGDTAKWVRNPSEMIQERTSFRFSLAGRVYMSVLEGIHNGAKMAMFARGMSHLRRVHKGVRLDANTPAAKAFKHDVRKLANEVRGLSGDMSKQGSSRILSAATSAIPYSNITIQSMSRLAHAFGTHPARAMFGMFNGIAAPALAGVTALAYAGNEALDWYYNKVPGWQRAGNILLPGPELVMWLLSNSWDDYEFDPNDWMFVPIAPELVPLKEAFMAAANALFDFRSDIASDHSSRRDLFEGMSSVFNIIMPPMLNAGIEGSGYRVDTGNLMTPNASVLVKKPPLRTAAFDDTLYIGSEIHKNTADAFTALFGTAMRVATEMAVSAEASMENDGWQDAMFEALNTGIDEVQKRVPMANSQLWDKSQQYSATPITEKYYETMRDLSRVFGQFQTEMYGMVGNSKMNTRVTPYSQLPGQIKHDVDGIPAPVILGLVTASEQMFNNGVLTSLTDRMSAIVREKEQVRSKRAGVDPDARQAKLNELELERQQLAVTINDSFIEPWHQMMEQQLGQPITAHEFEQLVRRSVYGN